MCSVLTKMCIHCIISSSQDTLTEARFSDSETKQVCASVRKACYKLNKYAPFTMFGIQSNEKGDEFARTCILLF